MSNEDAVYLAKLAEQAERYEGTFVCGVDMSKRRNTEEKYIKPTPTPLTSPLSTPQ